MEDKARRVTPYVIKFHKKTGTYSCVPYRKEVHRPRLGTQKSDPVFTVTEFLKKNGVR